MDLAFLFNSCFTALADRKLKPRSASDVVSGIIEPIKDLTLNSTGFISLSVQGTAHFRRADLVLISLNTQYALLKCGLDTD